MIRQRLLILGLGSLLVGCLTGPSGPSNPDTPDPANPTIPTIPTQGADFTDDGCGGSEHPACADGKKCGVGLDCQSLSCQDGVCAAPTATDGIKNLDESDVDCGGASSPLCADGRACATSASCASGSCAAGVCASATATDGVKNGTETDVDCGGGGAVPRCDTDKTCVDASDCASGVCGVGKCIAPSGTDGVKNGDESDVDCGGTNTGASKCAVGRSCKLHADCATDACAYNNKCAEARSCTRQIGGETCGSGEIGDPNAKHESCCATAPIPNSNARVNKYLVTAGRMRAMVERLDGNVRGFVQGLPGNQWNPAWNGYVPSNKAEADMMLGSYWAGAGNDPDGQSSKRSCAPGVFGGHTYWTPRNGDDYSDFSQDQLDAKALNCVGWHMLRAFCYWEGGRTPTRAELASVYTNGGTTRYPWQWQDNRAYTSTVQDSRLNHVFSYGYPDAPGMRLSNTGALDVAWYISPPGRFPGGRNQDGVEIAGNLLTWVGEQEYYFTWNFSWENHSDNDLQSQSWLVTAPGEPNGYYAIGGRCAFD